MAPDAVFGPGADGPAPDDPAGPRTALPLVAGHPAHGAAHLARLTAGLEALDAPVDWLPLAWTQALDWAARQGPDLALRVRVNPRARRLDARTEPRPPAPTSYTLIPAAHPWSPGTARDFRLLPHKGCLGPWHQPLLARARGCGADDILLHTEDGRVLETAIASVGLAVGDRFLLPPLEGRVCSVSEVWDLPAWADERRWQVLPEPFTLQDLSRGSLWCFNALRGLWPAQVAFSPSHP